MTVGIVGIECYIPKRYLKQEKLEEKHGVSQGKYTIGLGQSEMAYVGDLEDITSIFLTVTSNLIKKYNINDEEVGRLEIGTETIIDHSKSIKSSLMTLFKNKNMLGIDNCNACYGGTAALLNSLNWLESSICDKKYAIVVCGDIAIYEDGPARPTGGCGAVALLLGKGEEVGLELIPRVGSYFDHYYDFYKPNLNSEYPIVDGKLSVEAYMKSLDHCYREFKLDVNPIENYWCFHSPYTKLVTKAFARLYYLKNKDEDPDLKEYKEDDYNNKDLEKTLLEKVKNFTQYLTPSLEVSKRVGNLYSSSLYVGLASLISNVEDLEGKTVYMFSFGSGSASSLFSFKVKSNQFVQNLKSKLGLLEKLDQRLSVDVDHFEASLKLRESALHQKDFVPHELPLDGTLFKGTYYLSKIDHLYRREYKKFE